MHARENCENRSEDRIYGPENERGGIQPRASMEQSNTTGEGTEGATAGEEGGSTASRKARAAQFAERTASKRKDARKLIKMEVRSRLQKRKKVTLQAEER